MPVKRLASVVPEVAMFAVVPEEGSVPDISEPTATLVGPDSWILYDLPRQAAGMLTRFTSLTE